MADPIIGFSVNEPQINSFLPKILAEGEEVLGIFLCRLRERSEAWFADYLVLSETRFMIVHSQEKGFSFKSLPYDQITGVEPFEIREALNTGALELTLNKKKTFTLTRIKRSNLDFILKIIQGRVAGTEYLLQQEIIEKSGESEGETDRHRQKYRVKDKKGGGFLDRFKKKSQ
ncbi:MAG: PH domain-containing protein [Magnetococcales bacterium]|nr:PH domain-containing protein [Magnetococcales bacterium]